MTARLLRLILFLVLLFGRRNSIRRLQYICRGICQLIPVQSGTQKLPFFQASTAFRTMIRMLVFGSAFQ